MRSISLSIAAPQQTTLLKPPLKWAGGKRWLVPTLHALWTGETHRRLVEPFCGGLAVGLGLQPSRALLNDANPHLINFYRQLQAGLRLDEAFDNDRAYYFAARDRFNALIAQDQANTPQAAALFYYLNRTGFNGLCRFNRRGLFNVPFGCYAQITYTQDFSAYQAALSAWAFTVSDFEQLTIHPDDFIYADPPYDVDFVSYAQGGFDWPSQERLAGWLAAQPCPVVASNQATPRILALYQDLGFTITTLPAPRRIACNGDRRNALEMLATKGL
jgi:DNA adenine methylase